MPPPIEQRWCVVTDSTPNPADLDELMARIRRVSADTEWGVMGAVWECPRDLLNVSADALAALQAERDALKVERDALKSRLTSSDENFSVVLSRAIKTEAEVERLQAELNEAAVAHDYATLIEAEVAALKAKLERAAEALGDIAEFNSGEDTTLGALRRLAEIRIRASSVHAELTHGGGNV